MPGGPGRTAAGRSLLLIAAVAALQLLAGCTTTSAPADPGQPLGATPPASPAPEPAPSGIDPRYAIPDTITKDYAEDVVNALYAAEGKIFNEIVSRPDSDTSAPTRKQLRALESVASHEWFLYRQRALRNYATNPEKREELARPFSGFRFNAKKLVRSTANCIVVIGKIDFSGTSASPLPGPELLYIEALAPLEDDLADVNPTPWSLADSLAAATSDGRKVPEQDVLDADLEDFGENLDHTCVQTST